MTAAIQHLYDRLEVTYPHAQLELGGIYANKPGYHNKRDNLPGSDYSVQHPDDRAGSGQDASALDITLRNPPEIAKLTQRLIDLADAHDDRIQVLREFLGTTNGYTVVGRDVRENRPITSDDSHLWHCHISVYRRYAGDWAAMDAVAAAITGGTTPPGPPPIDWRVQEMFAVQDTDGGIYLAGPGVWKHLGPDEWDAWVRFLPPRRRRREPGPTGLDQSRLPIRRVGRLRGRRRLADARRGARRRHRR